MSWELFLGKHMYVLYEFLWQNVFVLSQTQFPSFCSVPGSIPNVIFFGQTHQMATGDRQQAIGNVHCIRQQAISNRQKTIDTDPTHGQEEEEMKNWTKQKQHGKQEVEGRWPSHLLGNWVWDRTKTFCHKNSYKTYMCLPKNNSQLIFHYCLKT